MFQAHGVSLAAASAAGGRRRLSNWPGSHQRCCSRTCTWQMGRSSLAAPPLPLAPPLKPQQETAWMLQPPVWLPPCPPSQRRPFKGAAAGRSMGASEHAAAAVACAATAAHKLDGGADDASASDVSRFRCQSSDYDLESTLAGPVAGDSPAYGVCCCSRSRSGGSVITSQVMLPCCRGKASSPLPRISTSVASHRDAHHGHAPCTAFASKLCCPSHLAVVHACVPSTCMHSHLTLPTRICAGRCQASCPPTPSASATAPAVPLPSPWTVPSRASTAGRWSPPVQQCASVATAAAVLTQCAERSAAAPTMTAVGTVPTASSAAAAVADGGPTAPRAAKTAEIVPAAADTAAADASPPAGAASAEAPAGASAAAMDAAAAELASGLPQAPSQASVAPMCTRSQTPEPALRQSMRWRSKRHPAGSSERAWRLMMRQPRSDSHSGEALQAHQVGSQAEHICTFHSSFKCARKNTITQTNLEASC